MKNANGTKKTTRDSKKNARNAIFSLGIRRREFPLSWDKYVKVVCGVIVILLLAAIIIQLVHPSWDTGVDIKILLVALAAAVLIPYASNFEAMGVKITMKEKVDELTAWAKALPHYTLGSEFEKEEDLTLAEQYYRKSLSECRTFWPALFGLAGINNTKANELTHKYELERTRGKLSRTAGREEEAEEYSKAINGYREVLGLDAENVYSYNNLAQIYLNGPPQIRNVERALQCANKALEITSSLYESRYYQAEALNNLKTLEDYRKARDNLQSILDAGKLKSTRHWVLYELIIAKSCLGEAITLDDFNNMLTWAKENDEDEVLVGHLTWPEEQERYRDTDLPLLKQFLKSVGK